MIRHPKRVIRIVGEPVHEGVTSKIPLVEGFFFASRSLVKNKLYWSVNSSAAFWPFLWLYIACCILHFSYITCQSSSRWAVILRAVWKQNVDGWPLAGIVTSKHVTRHGWRDKQHWTENTYYCGSFSFWQNEACNFSHKVASNASSMTGGTCPLNAGCKFPLSPRCPSS